MSSVVKIALGIFFGLLLTWVGCAGCLGWGMSEARLEDYSNSPAAGPDWADSVTVERLETSAGPFGDGRITAVVTNTSSRTLSSVEVSFDLFEADGVLSRSTPSDYVRDIAPGAGVRVDAEYYQSENIDSVAVGQVAAQPAPLTSEKP